MAVVYTLLSSALLVLALMFVNPTQIVAQVKEVTPDRPRRGALSGRGG
ncbi:hypothetical protein [Sphaerisporangium perillae]|nr:hypothetical protein [Sphaerisporangium perillae]